MKDFAPSAPASPSSAKGGEFTQIPIAVSCRSGARLPQYSTEGASGADIRAHLHQSLTISPGMSATVPTGIHVAIPRGYEIQVRSRSGLASKQRIFVLNSPGTIDADYRGEICVILANFGQSAFVVEPDMRIAQLVLTPVYQIAFVDQPLEETRRGSGGFGQTGLD